MPCPRRWIDRLGNRRAGGHEIAGQLKAWGELASGWTVESAGDWICGLASVKLWAEMVLDLGWSKDRFAAHLTRLLCDTLLTREAAARPALAGKAAATTTAKP